MFSPQELHTVSMKVFEGVAVPTSWFVLPLFLIRVFYAQITGDSSEVRSAIKGVLLYFILIASFSVILDLLLQIPQSFLPDFSSRAISEKTENLTKEEVGKFELVLKSSPEILIYVMESILAIVYWIMLILHILVMVLLSSMAPIIFLLSCVLNIGVPVRVFFGLIIMSSTWPVMWYGFDQSLIFIEKVIPDQFGKIVLELLLTILKGIGPLSVAYMSLSSGPGKSLVSAASKGLGFATGASSSLGGASMGAIKSIPIKDALNGFKSRTNGAMSSLKRIENNGLNNNSETSGTNNGQNPKEENKTENAESSKGVNNQRTQPQEKKLVAEKVENQGSKGLNNLSIGSESHSGIKSGIQSDTQSSLGPSNVNQSVSEIPKKQGDLPIQSADQSLNVNDQSNGVKSESIDLSEKSIHQGNAIQSKIPTITSPGGINLNNQSQLNLSEYHGFGGDELELLNHKIKSKKL
ncbi:MAG TPA: hypothetical protein PLJ21_01005 [Pseudobdellovibrionaceae bacterium]|nr:hypothetical protein [Pseudobdellovibrionaceae bacterium]